MFISTVYIQVSPINNHILANFFYKKLIFFKPNIAGFLISHGILHKTKCCLLPNFTAVKLYCQKYRI